MTLASSRRLAIVAGVVLPIGETARRWHELGDPAMWFAWLDDWAIAAFLLYGAWRAARDADSGRPILAGAWGFAVGLGHASFVSAVLSTNPIDPSGVSMRVAVAVKAVMVLLALAALAGALRTPRASH